MYKLAIIIGILIFSLVTIIVLSADNSEIKKVQFTNQNLVINNENTDVKTKNVTLNIDKTNIKNTDLIAENKNIDIQNNNLKINNAGTNIQNTNYSNQDLNYNNQNSAYTNQNSNYSGQNTNYSNQNSNYRNQNINYADQNTNYNNQKAKYQNTSFENQNSKLDKQLSNYQNQKAKLKNIENSLKNQKTRTNRSNNNRYLIKNIDWSTWKSNFVNKIVDDSVNIHELDEYGIGTWFYYSFTVNAAGGIYNINVTSPYLLKEDKEKIIQMIQNYEYQDITVFPANSKRKTANVNAIVLLGDTEKKSTPSDFKDMERIKINLPN